MKIFLVSDSKTGINFFPELSGLLEKKIADVEIETIFVPFPEDIPAAVNPVLREASLVFVFVLYEELDFKVKALLGKLIDIDIKSKAKIVKVIKESEQEFGQMDQSNLDSEKEKLAEKWSEFILDLLFKPESFKPKEGLENPELYL